MGFRDPWITDSAEILADFDKVGAHYWKRFFATSPFTISSHFGLIIDQRFLRNLHSPKFGPDGASKRGIPP